MGIDPRVSRLGGEIVSHNTTDAHDKCLHTDAYANAFADANARTDAYADAYANARADASRQCKR